MIVRLTSRPSATLLSCYDPRCQRLVGEVCDLRRPVLAAWPRRVLGGLIKTCSADCWVGRRNTNVIRDDIGSRLVHLTKGEPDQAAAQVFLAIVEERQLRGGTGCIKGGHRCICFSEAPVSKLSHILANPMAHSMKYKPFGVMVEKSRLFQRGGRPVIYKAEAEYELLHETQRFRHVTYEPGSVDFTWEREWRICSDELELDLGGATLVVPNRAWEQWAQDQHVAMLSRRAMVLNGLIGPKSVTEFPWHFMVLEDLGVDIPKCVAPCIARLRPNKRLQPSAAVRPGAAAGEPQAFARSAFCLNYPRTNAVVIR